MFGIFAIDEPRLPGRALYAILVAAMIMTMVMMKMINDYDVDDGECINDHKNNIDKILGQPPRAHHRHHWQPLPLRFHPLLRLGR